MRWDYIKTSTVMTMFEVGRNRLALVLLVTIPALFFSLVWLTTGDNLIAFRLASVSETAVAEVSARSESLVFIGIAAVGLLSSFMAMNLIQKNTEVNRRLLLCGYRSSELITAKLAVMTLVVLVVSLYVGLLMLIFFRPLNVGLVILGLALAGLVHACYGLLVGSIVRRELEGMLLVVLLVNIDAGWLQNPVYYADAHNKEIIRYLPAYFPSQTAIVAAFTDHSITGPLIGSLLYAFALAIAARAIYFWRMRLIKP